MILLTILIFNNTSNAETFNLKIHDSSYKNRISVVPLIINNRVFDENGYDSEGYNEFGLGVKSCAYDGGSTRVVFWGTSSNARWNYDNYPSPEYPDKTGYAIFDSLFSLNNNNDNNTVYEGFIYKQGERRALSNTSQTNYEVCTFKVNESIATWLNTEIVAGYYSNGLNSTTLALD